MNENQTNDNEVEINFKNEFVHSDSVEKNAAKYRELFKDMGELNRKRFSSKRDDEIGISPIFVKFPVVVRPNDIITGNSALYRQIVELYTVDIFGDPEHSVLNITIPKEVAGKVIDFHNEWANMTYRYDGESASIMFISARKKDYKYIDAWVCTHILPCPELISEKDISDNGITLKFSARFLQSRDIDKIARGYLAYAKILHERIDKIGTI